MSYAVFDSCRETENPPSSKPSRGAFEHYATGRSLDGLELFAVAVEIQRTSEKQHTKRNITSVLPPCTQTKNGWNKNRRNMRNEAKTRRTANECTAPQSVIPRDARLCPPFAAARPSPLPCAFRIDLPDEVHSDWTKSIATTSILP